MLGKFCLWSSPGTQAGEAVKHVWGIPQPRAGHPPVQPWGPWGPPSHDPKTITQRSTLGPQQRQSPQKTPPLIELTSSGQEQPLWRSYMGCKLNEKNIEPAGEKNPNLPGDSGRQDFDSSLLCWFWMCHFASHLGTPSQLLSYPHQGRYLWVMTWLLLCFCNETMGLQLCWNAGITER